MQLKRDKELISKIRVLTILVTVGFAVSLIPMLYCAFYAHPLYDDYWFSATVHHQYTKGGNIIDLLYAAAATVQEIYLTWQGTFSAVLLFAFQPGVLGQDCYFITTFVMVGMLIGSHLFLFDTILSKWLHQRKELVVLTALFTLTMIIQFVPDIRQAFYWYNGSCYYTLFYALSLILVSMLVRFKLREGNRKTAYGVCSIFLALFIGGGNYSTALLTVEIVALFTLYSIYKRNGTEGFYLSVFLVIIGSLFISMAAPGNRVRADSLKGLGALKAVGSSIFYACVKIGEWTALPQCVFALIITPVLFEASKCCQWEFKWPLAVCFLALCLYASQLTPPLFAQADLGSGRQINVYYYSYYILMMFIIFYVCGWLNNRYRGILGIEQLKDLIYTNLWPILITLMFVWGIGCFSHHITNMTSVQTVMAIADKSVMQYDQEYNDILEQIYDGKDGVTVKNISVTPRFFGGLKLGKNNEFFEEKMAEYFEISYIDIE